MKDFEIIGENFTILKEPVLDEPPTKKRKGSEISKNHQPDDQGKYQCQQCDYETSYSIHDLRRHIESVHGGVRYSCNQCDHKATTEANLKQHKEYKH